MNKPEIHLIAAMAENRVIGARGGLPWRLPEDLKRFKARTMGKAVIFGRTTWDRMNRALPGRHVIVMSADPSYTPGHDAQVVDNIEAALKLAAELAPSEPVMVCGGAKVYSLFLPLATQMDLTRINAEVDGDAYFPLFDESGWVVKDEDHFEGELPFSYLTYRRA